MLKEEPEYIEILKLILPFIGIGIGWFLSEYGKIWTDKRADKKKLNRLLFFLLELRFQINKEYQFRGALDISFNKVKDKIINEFGEEAGEGFDIVLPRIKDFLIQKNKSNNKLEYLQQNIDQVIMDLADIFPVLAYELTGQFNIKERFNMTTEYYDEFEDYLKEVPVNIKEIFQPNMTKVLIVELEKALYKLSKKVDKSIRLQMIEKINVQDDTFNHDEIDKEVSKYFDIVKGAIIASNQ